MLNNLKKALVLFLIGAISGVSIWGVNELTKDQIAFNIKDREEGFYRDIFDLEEGQYIDYTTTELENGLEEIVVYLDANENGIVDNDETVYGLIYKGEDSNNYGDISILVGIKDDVVLSVAISDTTNTANFVKRIEKNNLGNFAGVEVEEVDYDSSTGATHTYGSVEKIVTLSLQSYQERGDE